MKTIDRDWRNARLYKPNVRVSKEPAQPERQEVWRPSLKAVLLVIVFWSCVGWGFWKWVGR